MARALKIIAKTSVGNFLSKLSGMLLLVLTVKQASVVLSGSQLGIWGLLTSSVFLVSMFDFGIPSYLTNAVGKENALFRIKRLRFTISNGITLLVIVSGIAGIAAFAGCLVYIKSQGENLGLASMNIAIIYGLIFGGSILMNGVVRVYFGLHLGGFAYIVSSAFNLLATLLILTLKPTELSGILGLSLLVQQVACVVLMLNLWRLGYAKRTNLNFIKFSRKILVGARSFYFLQMAGVAAWGFDGIMVTYLEGLDKMAIIGVMQKLFALLIQPLAMISGSMWGVYVEANALKKFDTIKKMLVYSLTFVLLLSSAASLGVYLYGAELIRLWTENKIIIDPDLLNVFTLVFLTEIFFTTFSVYLNGCGIMRPQKIAALLLICFSVPIKYFGMLQYGLFGFYMLWFFFFTAVHAGLYFHFFKDDVFANMKGSYAIH